MHYSNAFRARFGEMARRVGHILVFGQCGARVRSIFIWMSPLIAMVFATKVIKLLLWKPKLPDGVGLGEGIRITASDLLQMSLHSATAAVLACAVILEAMRRLWFRKRSALWIPIFAVVVYISAKLVWSLRFGIVALSDWSFLERPIQEWKFLFAIFRSDLLLVISLLWVAIGLDRAFVRQRQPRFGAWSIWILAPVVVILGLELAYFRKTGLNGTTQVLGFLLRDTDGMRGLALSELDWQSVLCVTLPLLGLAIVSPLLAARRPPVSDARALSAKYGFALLFSVAVLLLIPPTRLTPVFARYLPDTLARLTDEAILRPFRTGNWWAGTRGERHESVPPLYSYRLAVDADMVPKRNVVIVMMESVRASSTGLYESSLNNTPFLRELASKGARIEEMYAVAPRTSTAWVSILNGIYPGDSDALFLWSSLEERSPQAMSLARILRAFGYRTAFFLPTHLRLQNDEQLAKNFGYDDLVYQRLDQKGDWVNDGIFHEGPYERLNYFGYEDRILLNPIRALVRRSKESNTPLFLTVMTNAGHYPYNPPKTWQAEQFSQAGSDEYSDYLNSIAYIDRYLGDLYGIFSEAGILDSTIFLILGDHGESFGEHGPRQHLGQAYEEVLRIPAVLVAPGKIEPGRRIVGVRQQIDVFPTILDLLDIKIVRGNLPGTSMLSEIADDRRIYFNGVYEESTLAMRQGKFKYLYNFDRTPLEIYDLHQDPGETRDLAESYPAELIADVERDLRNWNSEARRALLDLHRNDTARRDAP